METIIVAFAAFLAGLFGHTASACVNVPVAVHVTANSGVEASPTLRWALLGVPPAC